MVNYRPQKFLGLLAPIQYVRVTRLSSIFHARVWLRETNFPVEDELIPTRNKSRSKYYHCAKLFFLGAFSVRTVCCLEILQTIYLTMGILNLIGYILFTLVHKNCLHMTHEAMCSYLCMYSTHIQLARMPSIFCMLAVAI